MDLLRRTWVEINLSALDNNIAEIKKLCQNKEIMAVVKANAYGHENRIICTELNRLGIKYFAVSNISEAEDLRLILPENEIMIFGYTEGDVFLKSILNNNFIQTVGSVEYAERLSSFALSENRRIRVHIKINTGMARAGIDDKKEFEHIQNLKGLICEGCFTHFAVSDSLSDNDFEYTETQQKKLLEYAKGQNLLIHSQNSGGILYHSDFESDMVRTGIIMYGYTPNNALETPVNLSPVMTLKSVINQLKIIKTGDSVSYGRTYTADSERLTAVVPIGYADGYSRMFSNKGLVCVRDILCPVLGRVCMDQIIIDVTGVKGVCVGDEVEIYSGHKKETSVEYNADLLGTIAYELVCNVGHRVPRIAVRKPIKAV